MVKIVVPRQLIVPFNISLEEFAVRSINVREFKKVLGGSSHNIAAGFFVLLKSRPLCLLEIEILFKYALLKLYWHFLVLLRAKD